jgi:hypothetical protein
MRRDIMNHARPVITEEALDTTRRIFSASVRDLGIIDADAAIKCTPFADVEPFDPGKFTRDIVGS